MLSSKRVYNFRNLQQVWKNFIIRKLGKNELKGLCYKIVTAWRPRVKLVGAKYWIFLRHFTVFWWKGCLVVKKSLFFALFKTFNRNLSLGIIWPNLIKLLERCWKSFVLKIIFFESWFYSAPDKPKRCGASIALPPHPSREQFSKILYFLQGMTIVPQYFWNRGRAWHYKFFRW